MLRRLSILLLSFFIIILLAPIQVSAAQLTKIYRANTINENIQVQNNGSLLVHETITFQFIGGPFTKVFRDLPQNQTDGITVKSAWMDDQETRGLAKNVTVKSIYGNQLEINWLFHETSNSTHTFQIIYLVKGVIQKNSDADLLSWNALPTTHDYDIDTATITVTYPAPIRLAYNPSADSTSDVQITSTKSQITFLAHGLKKDEAIKISIPFASKSIIKQSPVWQEQMKIGSILALPSMGLMLLIIFAGWFLFERKARKYKPHLPAGKSQFIRVTTPPDKLQLALAVSLIKNDPGEIDWNNFIGTFFDLAERSLIEVTEKEKVLTWQKEPDRKHYIDLKKPSDNLLPHEQAFLELLFTNLKVMKKQVPINILRSKFQQSQKFQQALRETIQEHGWLDPIRQRIRKSFLQSYRVLIMLTIVSFIATIILATLVASYYWLVLFSDFGLFILTIISYSYWKRTITVSDEWWETAWDWRKFAEYIKLTAANVGFTHSEEAKLGEDYLPYAMSFGYAENWARRFYWSTDSNPPAWFHTNATTTAKKDMAFLFALSSAGIVTITTQWRNQYNQYGYAPAYMGYGGGGFGGGGGGAGGGASGAS